MARNVCVCVVFFGVRECALTLSSQFSTSQPVEEPSQDGKRKSEKVGEDSGSGGSSSSSSYESSSSSDESEPNDKETREKKGTDGSGKDKTASEATGTKSQEDNHEGKQKAKQKAKQKRKVRKNRFMVGVFVKEGLEDGKSWRRARYLTLDDTSWLELHPPSVAEEIW